MSSEKIFNGDSWNFSDDSLLSRELLLAELRKIESPIVECALSLIDDEEAHIENVLLCLSIYLSKSLTTMEDWFMVERHKRIQLEKDLRREQKF